MERVIRRRTETEGRLDKNDSSRLEAIYARKMYLPLKSRRNAMVLAGYPSIVGAQKQLGNTDVSTSLMPTELCLD